jgi:hypothetical protein
MAKTSLAQIDKAYNEVLTAQTSGIPARIKQQADTAGIRSVSGFSVPDPEARTRVVNLHLEAMKKYALTRATFVADLAKSEIPVLATLPVAAWNTICANTGLVQLGPSRTGQIGLDVSDASSKLEKAASTKALILILCICTLASYVGVFLLKSSEPLDWAQWLILGFMGGLPGVLAAGMLTGMGVTDTLETFLFKRSVKQLGDRGLMKLVSFSGIGHRTQLKLPIPPADVCDSLLKADKYGLPVKIAAMPEAISFNPPLTEIVIADSEKRRAEAAAEQARIRAEWLADPIAYVERDGIVAIIAQFGEFPVEQALIDRLMAIEVVEEAY